jgi:hypothetical protein
MNLIDFIEALEKSASKYICKLKILSKTDNILLKEKIL